MSAMSPHEHGVPAAVSARASRGAPAPAPLAAAAQRAARRRWRISLDPRGQSLVEFAISFPVVMTMVLFGIDFGRVFLGWVQLTAAVREASAFASINPLAWDSPGSPAARTEYARLINAEAANINCTLPGTLPAPTFPDGNHVGSPVVVSITCQFSLITPLVGNILGSPIPVTSSAAFPIRSGAIGGTGLGGMPSFSPGPTAGPTAAPTPTPFPTPSAIPTAVPACLVPDLYLVNSSLATGQWTTAGFLANNLSFNPLVPAHYKIKTQSLAKGASVPCSSTMTVAP